MDVLVGWRQEHTFAILIAAVAGRQVGAVLTACVCKHNDRDVLVSSKLCYQLLDID